MIRGEDGELRAFRNVCRHRATRLREGRGTCGKALRCPYHGWTYRTDGRLIGVPEGRGFPGLKKADLPLLPARVEVFSGLRLRQPRRRRRAAARLARRARGAARALRPRAARALHGVDEPPAGELEDRRRQLSRGLPRPDRPSWTHAAARLPALHGRGGGGLRVLRGAAARQAVGQPARARLPAPGAADAGADGRGHAASGATSSSGRTRRSTSIPTRSRRGRSTRTGSTPRTTSTRATAPSARARRCAACSGSTTASTSTVADEDAELVARVQAGMGDGGWVPGPLGEREAGVAWFADHVRRALEAAA